MARGTLLQGRTLKSPGSPLLPSSVESARSGTITPTVLASTYGAKGDGVILYNAAMTAGSAVLTSTDSFVNFTNADVGKTIIVSGVAASNDSLVTTIASVQSSSQVTLAATATVSSPDPSGGRIAIYGTDDTAAIQAASDAAVASNGGYGGTLEFDAKVYIIAGALVQGGSRKCNSQLTLPWTGYPGGMGRLIWKGARDMTGNPFAPFVSAGGTVLVSTLVGQSYSGTYGVPSVIGGATREQIAGSAFSGWLFGTEDLCVLTPRNPSLSAFNLESCTAHNRRHVTAGTLEWGYNDSTYDTLAINAPTHPQACAFIDPRFGNQQAGSGVSDGIFTWGYFAGICPAEHTVVTSIMIQATRVPIAIRGGHIHHARFNYVGCQLSPYVISGWDPTQSTVSAAIVPVPSTNTAYSGLLIDSLDLEDYSDATIANSWAVLVNHVNDANNHLTGYCKFSRWSYVSGVFTAMQSLAVSGGGAFNMESNTYRREGGVVGRTSLDPSSNTNKAMTQGAWTAIDTANLSITFFSGRLGWMELEIEFYCTLTGASTNLAVGCVDASGNYVPNSGQLLVVTEASGVTRRVRSKRFIYPAPDNTYTWRAAYYMPTAGQTGTIYYGGSGLTGNTALPNGQINFQIKALGNAVAGAFY